MCLLMVAGLGLEPRYSQLMRLVSYHYSIPQYYWLFIKLHLTQTHSNSFEKTFELLHQISVFFILYIYYNKFFCKNQLKYIGRAARIWT